MKKVLAILSVFALMIALVGLAVKEPVKADNKFTEDPTIDENVIPMYIMNSIYTTFPNYYDNATKADGEWAGASRMYPWNETRLRVKQMDASGKYTGKEYAVYFSGAVNASEPGAGNNILFYDKDDSGNAVIKRMGAGKFTTGGNAMDPSLSHMRTNLSDEDVTYDPKGSFEWGDEGSGHYNRLFVFDANGRMVRGIMGGVGYQAPGSDGAIDEVFAPEYCYVDGVVSRYEEGIVCDKVKEQVLDPETKEPVVDENGDPVFQDTEADNFLYTRFLWQWVSEDDFSADDVNDCYLTEDWDAEKWDFAIPEESSNGYILICFLPSENSSIALTQEQIAVYTAAGKDAPAERTCAKLITVPAHGYTYDFGYLDKGKTALYNCFSDMFRAGYYYGRTVDENGKGMAYQETVNFSASPLVTTDKVVNGVSYQTMAGQNTIEVLQGETFHPGNSIVYSGMAKYWAVDGDLTSYKADTSVLDLTIIVNGVPVVQPSTGYTSFEGMVEDFMADVNAKLKELKGDAYVEVPTPTAAEPDTTTGSVWYSQLNGQFLYLSAPGEIYKDAAFKAKWKWLIEYIGVKAPALGINAEAGTTTGPGDFTYTLYHFLNQTNGQMSGWPANKADWTNGAASEWLDARTNIEKWNDFAIDTSVAPVDTNYEVVYQATNKDTQNSSEIAVRFVVVDEYTPILKVNKGNLIYTPVIEGEKVVVPAVDKYSFCTAYNAAYNGVSILGDNISYKVHYESETLNFDAPTEGEHLVKATVYSASGAKFATTSFVVSIEDLTAPRVRTRDLTLAYGSYFVPTLGITFAYDAVDGNLMDNNFSGWWNDASKTVVRTDRPGNYRVTVEVADKSSNVTTVSYNVTVLEASGGSDVANLQDSVEDLASQLTLLADSVEGVKTDVAAVKSDVAGLKQDIAGVKADIANLKTTTDTISGNTAKKCGSKSALVVELLAAVSLLGVFLRKRH